MGRDATSNGSELSQVREAYRAAAELVQRQQEALGELHRLVVGLAQDNLRLHRRSLSTLESLSAELQRMRRQIQRLTQARS